MKLSGFLDNQQAASMRALAEEIYSFLGSSELGSGDLATNFAAWDGVHFASLEPFLEEHRPDLATRFYDLASSVSRKTRQALKTSFLHRWQLHRDRSYFRRHGDGRRHVPWHIDADAAAVGASEYVVNVWIPLRATGTLAPSLDFAIGSNETLRYLPLLPPQWPYRDDSWVEDRFQLWTPILELGDAVAFDQFTLHRTQRISSGMLPSRLSCEFRFRSRPVWS